MQIYQTEIEDGLEQKIKSNTSIALNCLAEVDKKPALEIDLSKSIAGFSDGLNYDLYYIKSILASVGVNKNDDVFLPEEIWAARDTPVHKQFNYMHNEKDIIGTIIESVVLDRAGAQVVDESQVQNIKDIATQAVIWTKWEDKDLQNRLLKIVADIESGKLYVSMECLFKEFDYMLTKGNVTSIVERNKDTAFLTKYLRIVGGEGEYNGSKINRVLRNFTFSGKGLVEDPANERSIIDDKIFANVILSKSENIMPLDNLEEMKEIKAALSKAEQELADYKKTEADQVSAEISALKAENESLAKQVAELTTLAQATKDEMAKKEEEAKSAMDKMEEDCEAKVSEANKKLVEIEASKVLAERKSKLVSAQVDSTKIDDIIKTWATSSEDQFAEVVKLYSKAKSETAPEPEKKAEAGTEFDLGGVKGEVINPNGDDSANKEAAAQKALAAKIAEKFAFSKNKTKTNKNKKNGE